MIINANIPNAIRCNPHNSEKKKKKKALQLCAKYLYKILKSVVLMKNKRQNRN